MAKYRLTKKSDGSYDLSAELSTRSGVIWRGHNKGVALKDLGLQATVLAEKVRSQRVTRGMVPAATSLPGSTS